MEEKRIQSPGLSVNLETDKITIHRTTLAVLGYPEFYRFLLNLKEKQLAIQACGMDDAGAHRLPEMKRGDAYEVNSKDLLKLLYRNNPWHPRRAYRMWGTAYPEQKIVSFRLDTAEKMVGVKQRD